MSAKLSYLDISILCWLEAQTQLSDGLLAACCGKLLRELSNEEQEMIQQSIATLETEGLVVVGRTSSGTSTYCFLTPEGQRCLSQVPGLYYV